jgi:hypothetical protein
MVTPRGAHPVVGDGAGPLKILERDGFDVEGNRDLVAHHHATAGQVVLPRHAKVVPN